MYGPERSVDPGLPDRDKSLEVSLVDRARALVGQWAELTGQWVGIHDLLLDRIVLYQGHAVLGHSLEQISDIRFMRSIVHPEELPVLRKATGLFYQLIQQTAQAGTEQHQSLTLVHRLQRANGTYARVQRHIIPLMTESDGSPRAMLHLCRDISALAPESTIVRWNLQGPEVMKTEFDRLMAAVLPMGWTPTQREHEIIQHLAQGATSQRIAEQLHLSVLTVNGHRRNMLKKSGLPNTAALLRLAAQEGWI